MANILDKNGITTGQTVEAYHVTQSIDAFTGTEAYDITLSGSFTVTGSIHHEGNQTTDGTITATQFIGPLNGTASHAVSSSHAITASYAQNAPTSVSASYAVSSSYSVTASYAENALTTSYTISASYEINYETSSSYAETASIAISSSYATTASYAQNAPTSVSASYAATASYVENAQTASYVENAQTASYVLQAISSSYAATASYYNETDPVFVAKSASLATTGSNNFTGDQTITGNLTVHGTTSVEVFHTIYNTSSIIYASGSTQFGDTMDDTHVFTGSLYVTGSVFATASNAVSSSYAVTASYALQSSTADTASYVATAQTASYVLNAVSASQATTASYALTASYLEGYISPFPYTGSAQITGSLDVTGSVNIYKSGSTVLSVSGSFGPLLTVNDELSGSIFRVDSGSATLLDLQSDRTLTLNGSQTITGSLTVVQGITGSLDGTASWANNAVTASYVLQAVSSSYADTASFYGGTVTSASYALSASYADTASISTSSSYATTASYAINGGVTQLFAGPNITLSPTTGLGQVTISSAGAGTYYNTSTGSYGSFYDTTTQTNPVANIPRSMSLNTTDITNGVSISGSSSPFDTYLKIENAGVYNIQFSAQLYKSDSGTDFIEIWLRRNGVDLLDSATNVALIGNHDRQVAAWNWFSTAGAGDYYQIMWASADTGVQLLAEPATGVHPGIPSVIATVNRIDTFLSNTGSFSGSFNGVLNGTASWADNATTASFVTTAQTASYVLQAVSSSFASTASYVNPLNQELVLTGSLNTYKSGSNVVAVSGSTGVLFTVEDVISGSLFTVWTGSTPILQVNSDLTTTISGSLSVSEGITGSLLGTASTASFVTTAQTASYVLQAVSASFVTSASLAQTASFLLGTVESASYALTASSVNPLDQTLTLTGSFNIYKSGSTVMSVSGSFGPLLTVNDELSGSLWRIDSGSATLFDLQSDRTLTLNGSQTITGSLVVNQGATFTGTQLSSSIVVPIVSGSATQNYSVPVAKYRSFSYLTTTRPIYEDNYIRLGYDSSGTDPELTVNTDPSAGRLQVIVFSTTTAAETVTDVNVASGTVDIYPNGIASDERLEITVSAGSDISYPFYRITMVRSNTTYGGNIHVTTERFFTNI